MAPVIEVALLDRPVDREPLDGFPATAGAECIFLGRTRADHHPVHGDLRTLHYEAYRPMAQTVLEKLAHDAVERFGCLRVRLHHALGEVPIGDASVLIQVVCGHREKSFDACRYLIDELKTAVPIWKREDWADGTTWSEGTAVPDPGVGRDGQ